MTLAKEFAKEIHLRDRTRVSRAVPWTLTNTLHGHFQGYDILGRWKCLIRGYSIRWAFFSSLPKLAEQTPPRYNRVKIQISGKMREKYMIIIHHSKELVEEVKNPLSAHRSPAGQSGQTELQSLKFRKSIFSKNKKVSSFQMTRGFLFAKCSNLKSLWAIATRKCENFQVARRPSAISQPHPNQPPNFKNSFGSSHSALLNAKIKRGSFSEWFSSYRPQRGKIGFPAQFSRQIWNLAGTPKRGKQILWLWAPCLPFRSWV